jgi:hypothetical protein
MHSVAQAACTVLGRAGWWTLLQPREQFLTQLLVSHYAAEQVSLAGVPWLWQSGLCASKPRLWHVHHKGTSQAAAPG